MKTCKCGDPVKGISVEGRYIDPKNRSSCFKCVPFGSSPYSQRANKEERLKKRRRSVARFNEKFVKEHGTYQQTLRYRERRQKVISILGGGCQICGYNKLSSNLVFHHLSGKDTSLSNREFQKSPQTILPEICKCVLVCHNCHGEIHGELIKPEVVLEFNNSIRNLLFPYMSLSWADIVK
jgi:hypothetical protein